MVTCLYDSMLDLGYQPDLRHCISRYLHVDQYGVELDDVNAFFGVSTSSPLAVNTSFHAGSGFNCGISSRREAKERIIMYYAYIITTGDHIITSHIVNATFIIAGSNHIHQQATSPS